MAMPGGYAPWGSESVMLHSLLHRSCMLGYRLMVCASELEHPISPTSTTLYASLLSSAFPSELQISIAIYLTFLFNLTCLR